MATVLDLTVCLVRLALTLTLASCRKSSAQVSCELPTRCHGDGVGGATCDDTIMTVRDDAELVREARP